MEESCAFVYAPKPVLNEDGTPRRVTPQMTEIPICDAEVNDALDEEVLGVSLFDRVAETEKDAYLAILDGKLEVIQHYLDEIVTQVYQKNYENIPKLNWLIEILGEK